MNYLLFDMHAVTAPGLYAARRRREERQSMQTAYYATSSHGYTMR